MGIVTVKPIDVFSWYVFEETDEDYKEHYVNFNLFYLKFTCDCIYNVTTDRDCRHIRYCKKYITKGTTTFEH